jgi:hypothetical protein
LYAVPLSEQTVPGAISDLNLDSNTIYIDPKFRIFLQLFLTNDSVYCILASCYIRLTLNICSFIHQCNTFTSYFLLIVDMFRPHTAIFRWPSWPESMSELYRPSDRCFLNNIICFLHAQHRNTRTLPVAGSAHDNGRTMVCAEYGNTEGSPNPKRLNTKSAVTATITASASACTQMN